MTTPNWDVACVFCEIIARRAPASVVRSWPEAIAFVPLNPVTEGHVLVVPKAHVREPKAVPLITGAAFQRAAELAHPMYAYNLIASGGRAATQTIDHVHVHLVPRRYGDGLPLPWTPQQAAMFEPTGSGIT